MSTDWGIGCRDCARAAGAKQDDYFSGAWNNCRYAHIEMLVPICSAADEILAAADKLGPQLVVCWNDSGASQCYGLVEFLRKHRCHRLAPCDQYGRFHDQCAKRVQCEACFEVHHCALPVDHEGPCLRRGSARPSDAAVQGRAT